MPISTPPPDPSLYAGKYRLVREIGRGGMGSVHEAIEVVLDRTVAIKRITHDPGDSLEARQRFRREVSAAARLTHPGIAQVLGYGSTEDGENYIAMELVQGENLRQAIANAETPRELIALFDQIFATLSYAHARGVVHRDLKPDNIFVTRLGSARLCKLLDFGVARFDNMPPSSREVVGTPRYMAPEQVLADPVGPPGDLYSVGCMLFEALTGELPISGKGTAVMQRKLNEDAPPLEETQFGPASATLRELVAGLLERDPSARLSNAADARALLAHCPEARDDNSRLKSQPPRARADRDSLPHVSARTPPFIGRENERAVLMDALMEVEATGEARFVVLEGDVGIGKSQLLRWFAQRVREEGGRTVLGGAYVESGGADSDAFRSAMEQFLGGRGRGRDQLRQAVERFLERHGGADSSDEEDILEWLRPHSSIASTGMASEFRQSQTISLIERVLTRLSSLRPVVITIDDLQWGGRATLDLLSYLVARWREHAVAVLIVGCVRTPVEERDTRQGYQRLATLDGSTLTIRRLEPLSAADSRRLITSLVSDSALPNIGAIVGRAAGNPMFCVQLARLARERELASDEPPPDSIRGTRSERRNRDSLIPASIQQLVEERVEAAIRSSRNPEAARTLLTEIAVLMPPVPTSLLEMAITKGGMAVATAQRAVDDLVESCLLREVQIEGVEAIAFDHPMIGEIVLSHVQHRVMRRRNADALELKEAFFKQAPERVVHQLAEHAFHAQLGDRARELGLAAARRALNASRYGEAMKFARRLVDAADAASQAPQNEVALLSARIAEETGDATLADHVLSSALSAHPGEDALELALALTRVRARAGRLDEARSALDQAREICRTAESDLELSPRARAELGRLEASIARRDGRYAEAVSLLEKVTELEHKLIPSFARLVFDNLAWARHRMGDATGAILAARRALELSAPGLERGWALRTFAVIGGDAVDVDERRDHLQRSLEIGHQLGAYRLVTSALTHLGELERTAGDVSAASDYFRQVVQLGPAQVDHDDLCEAVANLSMMSLDRGSPADGLSYLDIPARASSSWGRTLRLIRVTIQAATGSDITGAHDTLRAIQTDPEAFPACWGVARAAELMKGIMEDRGDPELAAWAAEVAASARTRIGHREASHREIAFNLENTDRISEVTRREVPER